MDASDASCHAAGGDATVAGPVSRLAAIGYGNGS
jgi:hypothetical protein